MRAEDLVAVVVCTRDRPAMLRDLLATLPVALRPGDELVVVDSASRDPRVAKVLEAAAGSGLPLRVVRCERPGASRARNAGVAATTAPVIAFVDDDCRPTAGWTAAIAGAFARHPEIGFAYGSVIADDAPGIAVAVLPDAPLHADLGNIIGLGHGANLAVRSTAFQSVGGFDEALGPGAPLRAAEDKDLQARLLRSGWEGRFVPDAVVIHHTWRTRGQALAVGYRYGIGLGALAMKLLRLDRDLTLFGHALWLDGIRPTAGALRHNWRYPALAHALRTLGVVDGAFRASVRPLEGSRFRPTRRGR